MRVLVIALPRTCSSVTTALIANKFELANLHEIYSTWSGGVSPYGGSNPNVAVNADRVFAGRHGGVVTHPLPDSLIIEDGYCGKLLTSLFLSPIRFNYQTFAWEAIDKIVFTARENIADQVASWLTLESLYFSDPTLTAAERQALHPTFKCNVNLNRLSHIDENFNAWQNAYQYIHTRYPEKCAVVTYEMFQSPRAAETLSNALGWTFTPDDILALPIKKNEKNYAKDVVNYRALEILYNVV